MSIKIDTRYGSIWDELPVKYEQKVPETQEQAEEFYEAAKSSMHDSLMKTIDAHNESMRKSAEIRQKAQRKKEIENAVIERRQEQREIFEAEAVKRRRRAEIFA